MTRGSERIANWVPTRWLLIVMATAWIAAPPDAVAVDRDGSAASADHLLAGGVVASRASACAGYNLMAPLNSSRTFLFDMQGRIVRTWESDCTPAMCAYLLPNGNILRGGAIGVEAQVFGPGPGVGGRVQEFSWDGELVWDFHFYNAKQLPHHDLTTLPNGHVLMIVWDRKGADEALAAGRRQISSAPTSSWTRSLRSSPRAGRAVRRRKQSRPKAVCPA